MSIAVKNVAIIGAGLGGLACAIALRKQGVKVRVYEQAKDFRPVGGALALFPNGLNFLELIEPEIVADIKNSGCCVQKIVKKNLAGETINSNSTTQQNRSVRSLKILQQIKFMNFQFLTDFLLITGVKIELFF